MNNIIEFRDNGKCITKKNLNNNQYVTMVLDKQIFALPVIFITDVLPPMKITSIPLARDFVIGLINLRGRVITSIDLRSVLSINTVYDLNNYMNVVISYRGQPYSIVVDKVIDLLEVDDSLIIKNPDNLDKNWQSISKGIYTINNNLIVIVDINSLFKELY